MNPDHSDPLWQARSDAEFLAKLAAAVPDTERGQIAESVLAALRGVEGEQADCAGCDGTIELLRHAEGLSWRHVGQTPHADLAHVPRPAGRSLLSDPDPDPDGRRLE